MSRYSGVSCRSTGAAVAALLLAAGSTVSSKDLVTASRWSGGEITIDGRSGDWPSVQGIFLAEQNAAFTFNNDGDYLYVLFRTTDLGWAQAIKQTGLTLYFDLKGGKKKDASLCFKGGPTMEQAMALRARGGEQNQGRPMPPDGQGPRGMRDDRFPTLTCTIKDRVEDKDLPLDGSAGPAAAFDTCQGFFTYEFRIPLATGEGGYYGLGAAPGQAISVGGVWGDMGEMIRPEGGVAGPGGMSGPGGGMGGPGGGMGGPGGGIGGPGGGIGGPRGERPKRPEKQEVWIKTSMAAAQYTPSVEK